MARETRFPTRGPALAELSRQCGAIIYSHANSAAGCLVDVTTWAVGEYCVNIVTQTGTQITTITKL